MALTKAPAELLNLDSSLTISGTTPSLTIGDAGAEDTKIVFDGNAQDFYIGLDDSADTLIIGNGSTVGSSPAITVDSSENTNLSGSLYLDGDADTAANAQSGSAGLMMYVSSPTAYVTATSSGNNNRYLELSALNAGTRNDNQLVLSYTGDVGIGTDAPTELLEVYSTGASTAIEVSAGQASTTTGEAKIVLRSLHSSSGTTYSRSEIASLGVAGGDSALIFRTTTDSNGPQERMRIFEDGSVGLGTNWNGTKDSPFKVMGDGSGWLSVYHNDGNNSNRYGIKIACGSDDASGTNYAMGFDDGDLNANQGYITWSGGTVTYGAFTAHHPCVIPDADNDPDSSENAYPYGTLLETISLSYTQTEETDTERGIRYNVQKSSGAYSKKVLGAYGSSMNDAPHNPDNEHQALVLGDGHILCNNEKGNISVGDGICTSSTAGIGMKADKMAMIIGIAQEDVTFSGSETKLVAVQYGLQQFTPWTD